MLGDCTPGQQATIRCHHAVGAIRQRLLDLGFVPGAKIDMVRSAPLGDPVQCKVSGYNVTLRRSEANLIELENE
ncbi:MAG: ferrous iron transport protein A [Desulfotalea sp.]|nr:MAG: ferrous iron transport protein A [Desulfotalea sp.]